MSNTNKKSTAPIILAVALLVAVALMIFMLVQRNALSQQNEKLAADLAESQANWQAVSDEKTVLQGELVTVNNDLKEAQTSLAESLAKAEELNTQIATLAEEKAGLELDLTAAIAVQTELQGYIATTTDLLTATQENLATTSEQLETTTAQLTATAAERDQLVAANAALSEKLAAAEAVVSNATADLKAAREKRLESLTLLKSHNERTVAELNVQKVKSGLNDTQKKSIETKIADLETYIADLEAQIAEVTAQLTEE